MTDGHKERIFEGVRRMVIWDEPRSEVLHRLEVDGIDPAEALQMYNEARAERIAIIRADSMKQTALGVGLLLIGLGLLFGFFVGYGYFPSILLVICATAVVFGTWHFSRGLFYTFFANAREGSLANDD